ncbi:hypothetical protein Slin_3119 [Spirosoma linguale DSM 74]|uniref:Uncharacterized protein n=1 Tax=Spirosoma linguale (strain ATCC 33905 / DSM 74 / LMG 10896 / Claus 1) TaxID=504472 RepID=D2QLI3_SPILD|nr:hypothetical protein Slin_3119 [Spirosoma linguale DSM 74]
MNEVNLTGPKAIIRFMLYTDVNRRRAARVGNDMEVELNLALGSVYDYGTKHELLFEEIDTEPCQYIVAMLPYYRQIPHPYKTNGLIPVRLVYLTTIALWPFFEPIDGKTLNRAMLPE